MSSANLPTRSYARANQELAASFKRYLEARGLSPNTIRAYHKETVTRFVEFLGSDSVAEADRSVLRAFLSSFHGRGIGSSAISRHAYGLRCFFKFLILTGLARINPAQQLAYRKIPGRLPRVLTIAEVEALIRAAEDPFERAVVEVLYATGVRVSELANLRVKCIDFAGQMLLVRRGKGGKDRYVLFGEPAAKAMRDYLNWRPSRAGFLFEAPRRIGEVFLNVSLNVHYWYARFYVNGKQHQIHVGNLSALPTEAHARREFERLRLASRANLGRVHPHSLRRAMACHMLSAGGSIRVIQELLGHSLLTTTQIYTTLTADELKAVHQRCHPHEQRDGGTNVEKQ